MAAVTLKTRNLTKKTIASVFTTAAIFCVLIHLVLTLVALWNDCQSLLAKSSFSSSVLSQVEWLHQYFLQIFSLSDSRLDQSDVGKWNHRDISEICNGDFVTILMFVMTCQLRHDVEQFFLSWGEKMAHIYHKLSYFFQNIIVNVKELEHTCVMFATFCILLFILLLLSKMYSASMYYKKSKNLGKGVTSPNPYHHHNYNNSSLSLARHASSISQYELTFGSDLNRGILDKGSVVSMCFSVLRWLLALAAFAIVLSIPWEFIRLYQKAVAHRVASVNMGLPNECSPKSQSWMDSIKSLLRWHLSWSHDDNPCKEYYHATLVDPLWEVNPLLVLTSVLSRGLVHPLEVTSSSLGRSIRIFFAEIPAHWQPVVLLVTMVTLLAFLLVLCSYRVSIPLLLRIEPKTPVGSPAVDSGSACQSQTNGSRGCGGRSVLTTTLTTTPNSQRSKTQGSRIKDNDKIR